jgi:hypothetical protein
VHVSWSKHMGKMRYCAAIECACADETIVHAHFNGNCRVCSRGTPLSREDLIKQYFYEGYQYRAIVCFLYFVHGIRISHRQLKRVLNKLNLHRRVRPTANSIRRVVSLVQVKIYLSLSR